MGGGHSATSARDLSQRYEVETAARLATGFNEEQQDILSRVEINFKGVGLKRRCNPQVTISLVILLNKK